MKLEEIELHDAVIKKVLIDYSVRSIVFEVEFYENSQSPERRSLSIEFTGVT